MKTSEFISKVEEMGYEFSQSKNFVLVRKQRVCCARVSKRQRYVFEIDFEGFNVLPDHEQQALFNLVVEYAKTPIEEEEE